MTTTDKLTTGQVYDVDSLDFIGWDGPDDMLTDEYGNRNPGLDGYSCWDYFDQDGRYLGPDMHGVEPRFSAK